MNRVGLYSIGVRGFTVPELLAWAHRNEVDFIHLRGGPRGYDLARREAAELARWRRAAAETTPITGITADLDLADLHHPDPGCRGRAHRELHRLSEAARELGAGWVRLPARYPLSAGVPDPVSTATPLLLETHHPAWWQGRPYRFLLDLLEERTDLALLADTAQLTRAFEAIGPRVEQCWERVATRVRALHLSDDGTGLGAPGHRNIARDIARRIHAGQQVEVAVEWTGPDRTPTTCLDRHRSLTRWWHRILGQEALRV